MDFMDFRIKIRQLVFEGRIDQTIQEVNKISPEILSQNKDLDFSLKCQKLIEMIKSPTQEVKKAILYCQKVMEIVNNWVADP